MKKILFLILMLYETICYAQGPIGFATYSDLGLNGVTGGKGGEVVHVDNKSDFARYISDSTPRIVVLDADITGGGMQGLQDELSLGSNKTILGSGSGHALNGICLDGKGQENIILRNITLTKGITDGISMRNCHHVWIDHCDLSDSQDGLLDFTLGSSYLTVSWTKLYNHDKVSIINSGTCHFEDYGRERATYAYCWFADNVQRNPRFGYGLGHVYNCLWTNISSYCIGVHSQAQVLSENNYFTSSANKAFNNQYTTTKPYAGYITDSGSILDGSNPKRQSDQPYTGISFKPTDYYSYDFDLSTASLVPELVRNGCGPKEELEYQPILYPGNGAVNIDCNIGLSWHSAAPTSSSDKVYIGTTADNLQPTDVSTIVLQPNTAYFWKVISTIKGHEYDSGIYHFTTAGEQATMPYPAHQQEDAWLRWPQAQYEFCTSMPLTWRNAFNAKSYNIYLSEKKEDLDTSLIGNTTTTTITPKSLTLGKTYYWRVDVVKANNETIQGDIWTFSTPRTTITAGKNEAEKMYLSGLAFTESFPSASNGTRTAGDQGPGSLCALWNGEEGKYAIKTAYYNETNGISTYGLTVNGKLIDKWYSSTDNGNRTERKTRHSIELKQGDEVRIEFIAGPRNSSETSEARARVDYITFEKTDKDIIDTDRPSAIPHTPISTTTWDCEYIAMENVIFLDSLGTVGDYSTYQMTDEYCSWISYSGTSQMKAVSEYGYINPKDDKITTMKVGVSPVIKNDEKLTFHVKETENIKFYYTAIADNTIVQLDYKEINGDDNGQVTAPAISKLQSGIMDIVFDRKKTYAVTLQIITGEAMVYAGKLYKQAPILYEYHAPQKTGTYDYEIIWSQDMLFVDSKGEKGDVGKVQIADGYDTWCKYYNNSANEIQAKNGSNAVYFLDPLTDKSCSKKSITSGSGYCYVVGTVKSMTYYIKDTKKMKFYYTGSGSAATALHLIVKENGQGSGIRVQGGEAKGKSKASNSVETELDASKNYTITIIADEGGGDMIVYAVKIWLEEPSGIEEIKTSTGNGQQSITIGQRAYNLRGQEVKNVQDGIIIRDSNKYLIK